MAYATLAELRAYAGIPADDTQDDPHLQVALDAASEQIDRHCGRSFTLAAVAEARYYTATSKDYVTVDAFQTTTGLVVETDDNGDGTFETTWTVGTDFDLYPYNAAAVGAPWSRLVRTGTSRSFPTRARRVKVTAKYGPSAVPAPVEQACLLQALRLFTRRHAPFGVAGSPDVGSEVRLLARLDPDVEELLRPFRRRWAVVTSRESPWPWT